MAVCGAIFALLCAHSIVGARAGASTTQSPQLRGSEAKAGAVTLRVFSKASFPVILANCDGNHTVPALQEYVLPVAVSKGNFFWVVPEGATWDCEGGCPECFYLAWGVEGGGLLARLGYETDDHDGEEEAFQHNNQTNASLSPVSHESNATVTGIELVVTETDKVTRSSSACGEKFCSPDWERDHGIAWSSTMDLIIQGSTHFGLSGRHSLMSLGYYGRRWYRRRYYRPPVWRRPVWRRPIYGYPRCYYCSSYCWWLCR